MSARALVIGGTAFFGRRLVETLLERGDDVTVLSRGQSAPDLIARVRHLRGDRNDRAPFEAAIAARTYDFVFDQIAFDREDVESARSALRGRIGKYVLTSTSAVYAAGAPRLLREDEADLDSIRGGEYAVGKRRCEAVLLRSDERFPFAIVRPPVVQGRHDPTGRVWFLLQRVLDGEPILVPPEEEVIFRHAWADDVVQALLLAAEKAPDGAVLNVASTDLWTYRSYIHDLAAAAGFTPPAVAPVLRSTLERAKLDTYRLPFGTGYRAWVPDTARIEALGFKPTAASVWLPDVVSYYRRRHAGGDSEGYARRGREVQVARAALA